MISTKSLHKNGLSGVSLQELADFAQAAIGYSDTQRDAVVQYLLSRKSRVTGDDSFGIVYAITHWCNLACKHCAVAAPMHNNRNAYASETTTQGALTIIDKVDSYFSETGYKPFFMFGGGEPTLRTDFSDILTHASTIFSPANVGFCTNGTLLSVESTLKLANAVGLLEVSIDGSENYHNGWRDPHSVTGVQNPFKSTLSLVEEAVKACPEKLEVSAVVTKSNLGWFPDFVTYLEKIGVRHFSVHRPMPVGRMAQHMDEIPTLAEFGQMIWTLAARTNSTTLSVHAHHSLESIFSTFLIGRDIHRSELPMSSSRHSIGIDWSGRVHFDPWSLIPPYSKLSPGSLLDEGATLQGMMNDKRSPLYLARELNNRNVRCKRCKMPCTGGMRFNALASHIESSKPNRASQSYDTFLIGMSCLDPACPLSVHSGGEVR